MKIIIYFLGILLISPLVYGENGNHDFHKPLDESEYEDSLDMEDKQTLLTIQEMQLDQGPLPNRSATPRSPATSSSKGYKVKRKTNSKKSLPKSKVKKAKVQPIAVFQSDIRPYMKFGRLYNFSDPRLNGITKEHYEQLRNSYRHIMRYIIKGRPDELALAYREQASLLQSIIFQLDHNLQDIYNQKQKQDLISFRDSVLDASIRVEPSAQNYILQGRFYHDNREYTKAVSLLKNALQLEPALFYDLKKPDLVSEYEIVDRVTSTSETIVQNKNMEILKNAKWASDLEQQHTDCLNFFRQ